MATNSRLNDIFNLDESMLDLNDYATDGLYLMLDGWPNNVIVPFERAPHFTIILGFCGQILLVSMLIRIGAEFQAPHPYHAELLQTDKLLLAQSQTGWVDTKLKNEYLQAQIDHPDVPFGQRPLALLKSKTPILTN